MHKKVGNRCFTLFYSLKQMMRNSQMVAAFGRRLFDEGELKETTTEDEDGDEENVNIF